MEAQRLPKNNCPGGLLHSLPTISGLRVDFEVTGVDGIDVWILNQLAYPLVGVVERKSVEKR